MTNVQWQTQAESKYAAANRGYIIMTTSVCSNCMPDIPVARSQGEAEVKATVTVKKTKTVREETGIKRGFAGKKKEKVHRKSLTTVII